MSWLFSQALVEAYSEANSSDGEPCAQLNVMPTRRKFLRNDKTIEPSNLSRFGLTCEVLTASRGEELLTWFLGGFPARTYLQPERVPEFPESEADSGLDLQESLSLGEEEVVPRVVENADFRTDRLKTIGNGQVPLVAATAFRILTNEI